MVRTQAKYYDDKRGLILTAATEVFAETGFDRAAMSQVAMICSVSKATLYHYFPSKNAILFAILDRHLKGLRDHVFGLEQGEQDNREFFIYVVEEILVFYRGNDHVHELQMHALGQLEPNDQEGLRRYMRDLVAHVSDLIKAVKPDTFADNDRLRMATMSLFGMLNWYYTWNRGRGVEVRRVYAKYAAQILLSGAYG